MRIGLFIAACLAATMPAIAAEAREATADHVADPTFAGHYYLSGIMETGSELLLREDGSFEWYISYGALDQFSRGRWHRDGDRIVLVARKPSGDRPLFGYLDTQAWSVEAEQALLDRKRDAAAEEVRTRCPFLEEPPFLDQQVVTTEPVVDILAADERVEQAALDAKADAALATARDAGHALEEVARRFMASGTPADEPALAEARRARSAWSEARETAIGTARAAGRNPPDLPDPILPEGCRMPEALVANPDASAQWLGGLAIRVLDPQSGEAARGVKVALRFADGSQAEVTSSGYGPTLVPNVPGADLVAAKLSAPYAPGRDVELRIPPTRSGEVRFSIDAEQLSASPFERMTLRIDGDSLLPLELGRGRYTR